MTPLSNFHTENVDRNVTSSSSDSMKQYYIIYVGPTLF